MTPRTIAFALLPFLNLCLASCADRVVVPSTKIVDVPVHIPQPAACARLRAVTLPAGSTAQDVIEEQHRVLAAYEIQIRECARP